MKVTCPVSIGEIVDKLSILRIKRIKISDPQKLENVLLEEEHLSKAIQGFRGEQLDEFEEKLFEINLLLWDVEDRLRECEHNGYFGDDFIQLARSVYKLNDQRFTLKNQLSASFGSLIREVKSYNYL